MGEKGGELIASQSKIYMISCYFCVDDVPKLRDLVYELRGVDWNELGVQLDVPNYILRNIGIDNITEYRKLSEVLNYWLNNKDVNWKVIVEALSRIGKHGLIITTIESKYIPSTRTCIKKYIRKHIQVAKVFVTYCYFMLKEKLRP